MLAVGYALVADRDLDDDRVPLLGVLAAFIFAVQMLNFPVAGGTSGHLLGATLAAVLLGPWLACLVMAVVLTVQCFVFADGGVTALGANILNMGVIGALLAGVMRRLAVRSCRETRAAFLATVGVVLLARGDARRPRDAPSSSPSPGTVPLDTVLPAMLGVHALIGVGEAVITVAAVSAVLATRPDLIAVPDPALERRPPSCGRRGPEHDAQAVRRLRGRRRRRAGDGGLAVRLLLPGRLREGRRRQGLHRRGRAHEVQDDSPIAGLRVPGHRQRARRDRASPGFAGTLGVFAVGYGVAAPAARRDDAIGALCNHASS